MKLRPAFLIGIALVVLGLGSVGLTEKLHTSSSDRIDWVEKYAYEAFAETVQDKAGDLVHLRGEIIVREPVTDPDTGLTFDALLVERDIQIYQWVEDFDDESYTDTQGDQRKRRVYSYARRWVSSPVRSRDFDNRRYENHGELPFADASFKSGDARLGDVPLSPELTTLVISELGKREQDPQRMDISGLSARWSGVLRPEGRYLATSSSPRIGDIRVSYTAVIPARVSVIAQYADGVLRPYGSTVDGDGPGNGYADVAGGDKPLSEMLGASRSRSGVWAWVFRLLSGALVLGGAVLVGVNRPHGSDVKGDAVRG
jgi:hypothetical protein